VEGVGKCDDTHATNRVRNLKIARQIEPGARNAPRQEHHRPGLNMMETRHSRHGKKDAPLPQREQRSAAPR